MQAATGSEVVGQQDLFAHRPSADDLSLLKYCQTLNVSVKSEKKDNDFQMTLSFWTPPDLKSLLLTNGEPEEALFRRICERVSQGLGWSANRSCRCVRATPGPVAPDSDVVAAFRMRFQKEQHLALLYRQIEEVLNFKLKSKVYAPSVSIYQHSGSGKTRTVIELGLCVFPLLYMCFREDDTEGYPSTATSPLRKYLLFDEPSFPHEAHVIHQLDVYFRYTAFLVASLVLFSRFWSETNAASGETAASFRKRLSVFLNAQLEGSIDERGSFLLQRLHTMSKEIEDSLAKGFGDPTQYFDSKKSVWKWAVIEIQAKRFVKEYKPSLTTAFPRGRVAGAICIDEERIFGKISSVDQRGAKQTLVTHMLRASRLLANVATRCCLIRMDTTPLAIDALLPVVSLRPSPSSRVMEPSSHHCVYSLTSARNLGADEEFEQTTDLAQTISMVSYMSRFGCPLWYSMGQTDSGCLELLLVAAQKLRGGLAKAPDLISLQYSAALFGATISVDVSPYLALAKDLVATHMAQVEYWCPERNVCKVGYPPDPILAVAAAEELFKPGAFVRHMDNFLSINDQETLSSGEVAERMTRLLLVKAASHQPVDDKEVIPMTVASFLRHFLAVGSEEALRQEITSPPGSEAAAAVLDGIINLRQFVPIDSKVTRPDVCLAAKRGFAYICSHCEVGMDLLIPVILKRPLQTFASAAAATAMSKKRARPVSEAHCRTNASSEASAAASDTARGAAPAALCGIACGGAAPGPASSSEASASVAAATEARELSVDELLFDDLHSLHLRRRPDEWAVATTNNGISFERLQSINTDSETVQETSVRFPRMSIEDLQTKDHQFSPEYVSYIAVRVAYRSGAMEPPTVFDPLSLLEPELRSTEASAMPRLALNVVFENVMSGRQPLTGHYGVLSPKMQTGSTPTPSALIRLLVVNVHCLLPASYQRPLTTVLQHAGGRALYRSWVTDGNRYSVERQQRVVGTENRPVASMEL